MVSYFLRYFSSPSTEQISPIPPDLSPVSIRLALLAAARIFGQKLVVLAGSNDREIDSSFATMAQRQIGALVVTADGFLISRQDQIVALAARYAMPAMYPLSEYIEAGGLMSYGANLPDAFLQSGIYVGRILKGARPADLPVLQSTIEHEECAD